MSVLSAVRGSGVRRRVAAALCLDVLLLVVGAGLVQLSATERERALDRRVDARAVTAAGFLEAYVADTFRREVRLARRSFAGDVTAADFDRLTRDYGFEAALLLDAEGACSSERRRSRS